jgi:hypothetical protein
MSDQPPPKPPFDPVRGAFVLLFAMTLGLIANSLMLQVGCAVFQVTSMCERSTDNMKDVALELITAIALLVSQRK